MNELFVTEIEEIRTLCSLAKYSVAESLIQTLQIKYNEANNLSEFCILRWHEAEIMIYLCQFAYSDELLSYKLPSEIPSIPKNFEGYYYFVRSLLIFNTSLYEEAEKNVQIAISLVEPYTTISIEALCLLGTILFMQNKLEDSESVLTNASVDAISEDFSYLTALTMETMGNFYSFKRDSGNALRLYIQALQFEKDMEGTILFSRIHCKLAQIYVRNKEYTNAFEHIKISHSNLSPQDIQTSLEVRYILAQIYFETKNFDKIPSIVEYMRLQLQSFPSIEMTVNLLMIEAQTFMVLEDFSKALKKTQEALTFADSLRSNEKKLHLCLIILSVYTKSNDIQNSEQYYHQIQDLLEQKPIEKTPYYYYVLFQYSQQFGSQELQFKAYKDYSTAWLEVHNNHIIELSNFLEIQSKISLQYSLDPFTMFKETIESSNSLQDIFEQPPSPTDPNKTAIIHDLIILVEEPLLHLQHLLNTSQHSTSTVNDDTHSLMLKISKYLEKYVTN